MFFKDMDNLFALLERGVEALERISAELEIANSPEYRDGAG